MKILYFVLLTLSVCLTSSFALIGKNGAHLLAVDEKTKNILVYVEGQSTDEAVQNIVTAISTLPGHQKSEVQNSAKTLSEFESAFPGYASGLRGDESFLSEIPRVITSYFSSTSDDKILNQGLQNLRSEAGVLSVESSFSWNESLKKLKKYSIAAASLGIVLLVIIVFSLTFLLIFRFISSERDRLEIMSYCGASSKQVYKYLFIKFIAPTVAAITAGLLLTTVLSFLAHLKISSLSELSFFSNQLVFFTGAELLSMTLLFFGSFVLCLFVSMRVSLSEAWADE